MPRTDPNNPYMELVDSFREIQAALDRRRSNWLRKPHIVGYAIGEKRVDGEETGEIAAVFFVDEKVPLNGLKQSERIPRFIRVGNRRILTDVVQVGPLMKLQVGVGIGIPALNDQRYRPIMMGSDIGVCLPQQDVCFGAGTAGAVVVRRATGDHFLLSAGHVFGAPRIDVIQPDVRFGGHNRTPPPPGQPLDPRDNIGSVVQVRHDTVDAGIAECIQANREVLGIGDPGQVLPPIPTLPVQKSGATTGVTGGLIAYVGATVFNDFQTKAGGILYLGGLQDAFFVRAVGGPFALPGDSGALIMAGSPTDPNDLGTQLNRQIAYWHQHMDPRSAAASERNLRRAMQRAVMGLVLQGFLAFYGGAHPRIELYLVSQEIQVALSALNVTMA